MESTLLGSNALDCNVLLEIYYFMEQQVTEIINSAQKLWTNVTRYCDAVTWYHKCVVFALLYA